MFLPRAAFFFRLFVLFVAVYKLTTASRTVDISSSSFTDEITVDKPPEYDFDLIVIGGGSAGLAAAKQAHLVHRKRVLVVDYVTPSPHGHIWREGGTCVNVGCIPKKIMHQAARIGEAIMEAQAYGWEITEPEKIQFNWKKMVLGIKNHVASENNVSRTQLKSSKLKKVDEYINGLAEFVDANTIKVTLRDESDEKFRLGVLSDKTRRVTAEHIIIAVGTRPHYPDIPGAKTLAITSDDLFYLDNPPGKTLIIGAGYIGMEVAGFLKGLGMEVTVLVRSVVLRGFDKEMAQMVKEDMIRRGVRFVEHSQPLGIYELLTHVTIPGKGFWSAPTTITEKHLRVRWKTKDKEIEKEGEGIYDTVLLATGRRAVTSALKVENAKINLARDGKIDANNEQTNVPNIFAVGDVLLNKPELTPVAVHAGRLLVDRIYGGENNPKMDYTIVPTTIFTPQEYSFIGMNEEDAISIHGEYFIEVYHSKFNPVEYSLPRKDKNRCYLKVICKVDRSYANQIKKNDDDGRISKVIEQKVIGMHFFGPWAGEVIQGYAVAMNGGLTFKQLQMTVGVHPTISEEFTRVHITKSSHIDPTPQSCCS